MMAAAIGHSVRVMSGILAYREISPWDSLNKQMAMDKKAQSRSLVIIWITIFIDLMGITLIIPYINDFVDQLGGDEQVVGILLASYAGMQLIFAPIWGRISDKVGRRPIILIGLLGSAVAFTIFGLADELWILFASRMLAGLANANMSVAQAYVADITPPRERAGRMGLIGAAFNLGFIIGFPVGGLLATAYGFQAPALLAAGMSLLNFIAALFILPESLSANVRKSNRDQKTGSPLNAVKTSFAILARFWRQPSLTRVLTTFFMFTIAFSIIHVTFIEYSRDHLNLSIAARGYVFMFLGIVGVVTQAFIVRRLVKAVGEEQVIKIGLVAMAIGLASMPFFRSLAGIYFSALFISLGNSLVTPAVTAVISMRSHDREQGVAMGVTQSLASMGRIIGPPFGGITYAQINYRFPFLAGAIMALLGLWVFSKEAGDLPKADAG